MPRPAVYFSPQQVSLTYAELSVYSSLFTHQGSILRLVYYPSWKKIRRLVDALLTPLELVSGLNFSCFTVISTRLCSSYSGLQQNREKFFGSEHVERCLYLQSLEKIGLLVMEVFEEIDSLRPLLMIRSVSGSTPLNLYFFAVKPYPRDQSISRCWWPITLSQRKKEGLSLRGLILTMQPNDVPAYYLSNTLVPR